MGEFFTAGPQDRLFNLIFKYGYRLTVKNANRRGEELACRLVDYFGFSACGTQFHLLYSAQYDKPSLSTVNAICSGYYTPV